MVTALALAAALAAEPPPDPGPYSLDEVASYLTAQTDGLIGLAPALTEEQAAMRWWRARYPPARFVPVAPRDPTLDQDAFTFDADAFTARVGARDFVDAKRRYYAELPWSERDQAHVLPYATPSAWQTLNHPPIKRLSGPLERWTDLFDGPPPDQVAGATSPLFDPAFQRELDALSGTGLSHGNRVRLLSNGEAYGEKLRLIRAATRRLDIAVMFWACDRTSDALAQALYERVQAGVDVRLITEGVYRETITRRCIDRLALGGVKVLSYGDALRPGSVGSVMHWKLWIRDGEEMIVGGENILDYENHSDGFNLLNRDTDLWVAGPAVTDADRAYTQAWLDRRPDDLLRATLAEDDARLARERADGVRGEEHYAAWLGDPATRMAGNCRVLLQGVNAETQPIGPVVLALLRRSERQVIFSTPTVRYDHHDPLNATNEALNVHRLMAELHDDRRPDGHRVVLLTNGIGGAIGESSMWIRHRRDGAWRARQWFLYRVARQFGDLVARRASVVNRAVTLPLQENPDVEVWTYFQYIHSKLWLFDRLLGMVGSWNLEVNSGELNPEAAVFCLDASLRDEMEADLALALVNSVPEVSADQRQVVPVQTNEASEP